MASSPPPAPSSSSLCPRGPGSQPSETLDERVHAMSRDYLTLIHPQLGHSHAYASVLRLNLDMVLFMSKIDQENKSALDKVRHCDEEIKRMKEDHKEQLQLLTDQVVELNDFNSENHAVAELAEEFIVSNCTRDQVKQYRTAKKELLKNRKMEHEASLERATAATSSSLPQVALSSASSSTFISSSIDPATIAVAPSATPITTLTAVPSGPAMTEATSSLSSASALVSVNATTSSVPSSFSMNVSTSSDSPSTPPRARNVEVIDLSTTSPSTSSATSSTSSPSQASDPHAETTSSSLSSGAISQSVQRRFQNLQPARQRSSHRPRVPSKRLRESWEGEEY